MTFSALDRLRRLRDQGRDEELIGAIAELVCQHPDDLALRVEAAYAHDRIGDEHAAMRHYDIAWRIGVPMPERREFLVRYGVILRKLGRAEEAVALLGEALAECPDHAPLKAVLALALHAAGHGHAALATLLDLVIDLDEDSGCLHGHAAILAHERTALLERAMELSR